MFTMASVVLVELGTFTCILGDVVQQEGVLGESQHLHGDDVFQLQTAAQTVPLSCLRKHKKKDGV